MTRRESTEVWREGPDHTRDTSAMEGWERDAYAYAKEVAVSRGSFLKTAGLGLGGLMLAPYAATAHSLAPLSPQVATTLTIGRATDCTTLDPHKTLQYVDQEVLYQIYDSLLYLGTDGKFYPGLATAWSFSRNGLVLKFKLRRGVTFHDGTPFDANAVKYSMDRWIDPTTAATSALIAGPLSKTEVIDDFTVALFYKEHFAPALVNLTSGFASIVSKAGVAKYGDQFGRNPVGTGAYKFVSWSTDGTIALERNAAHTWLTPALTNPNRPPIDTVEYRFTPNDATRIAALRSNQIAVLAGFQAIPANQVASLKNDSNLQVQQFPYIGISGGMVLNATRPPLTDVRLRQALSYAIDRKKIVALALQGQGKPATSCLPSRMLGYDPSVAKHYSYDPEKARSLLKAAGKSAGFTIDYVSFASVGAGPTAAAQIVQEDLAKIKVKMNIKLVPVSTYIATCQQGPLNKRPNSYVGGWAWPEPDIVSLLFKPNTPYAAFNDPTLVSLVNQQRKTLDRKKRNEVLSKIQQRMATKVYGLDLYEVFGAVAARKNVHNIHFDPQGYIHLQEMTLT